MREGYKETKLGLIPKDWKVVKQVDVATFYNGRAYKRTEWEDQGVPVIRLQNLTGSGKEYYYSNLELPEHQYCDKGNLLYMWSATFGPVYWRGDKAIYHYHIWKIEHNKLLNKSFHFYLLDNVTQRMKNESHGSTMLHVTKGGMEKLLIQLPPLQEQQKIAEILSTVDAKIEIIDQQILETQELKKGLMQQLLTKGIGHTEFKDSVLGKIPKSWEVVKLEKLIKIQSGISPSSVDFLDKGSQMFYKVSQLNDYDKYMDKSPYRFENNIRDNIPAKSIAFPKRGAAIFTNKVRVLSFAAMVDTNIMCLIPNKKIYNEFLFYFLLDFGLSRIADTSSIPQINNKHINPLKIALPSIKEQHKIAEILSATDKKLEVLSEKKTTYQELKQGLMQHLLTGKVRV